MALTGDEIRARLSAFAAEWVTYDRSERSEAQTFLNELFDCYGTGRKHVAEFEKPQEGKFVDLIWPQVCLIEMKAPGEAKRLGQHRTQALDYWRDAADAARSIPSPRFVVLCAFHRFEVWEPGLFPKAPRVAFDLVELPDRYDALLFLAGEEPVFQEGQAAVTLEAAQHLVTLNDALRERRAGGPDERRDFILQCVWCLFAEDLGQLPAHLFTRLLDGLLKDSGRSSADDLGRLFEILNDPAPERPSHGLYKDTPYADGGLFERPSRLHLHRDEIESLRAAAEFNWREVQPQIFGSLLEGTLGHDLQWQLGAHYTHDAELQLIVGPTIVRPWRERIDAIERVADAERAQADLMHYVVLDPACGSGNFLYLAYRELRRIERDLAVRLADLRREAGMPEQQALSAFFPLQNIRGIEIEPFAVALARVTLWMGHRLAVEELDLAERTLPLVDLSGVRRGDALALDWPAADAIIGNPPYHGSQNLREVLGDDRVEWLKERFDCGVKDLCVYWFRRAADQMRPGDRAGLVGTNSISQNRARGASLNHVVEQGGVLTDVTSRRKWPGDAVVNVSIVNWIQKPPSPPERFVLDGDEVAGISTRLRESELAIEEHARLDPNAGHSFQGPIPVGEGFVLQPEEAEELLARPEASYREVVRPYLIGDDITSAPDAGPQRWIVDFAQMPLERAMEYPAALDIVRARVKPERDCNRDTGFRKRWWLFGRPRGEMRDALAELPRYIAGNAQGKRFLFTWQDPATLPSNLTNVFAFDDEYAMGVLTAAPHQAWAHGEGSTLRIDPRYTPTSCFETYPWPDATAAQREAIGAIAAELLAGRQAVCAKEDIGLTAFYNAVDEGAYADVAELHRRLDAAVCDAYGWTAAVASDPLELRARLAALNGEIARGERAYEPFGDDAPRA